MGLTRERECHVICDGNIRYSLQLTKLRVFLVLDALPVKRCTCRLAYPVEIVRTVVLPWMYPESILLTSGGASKVILLFLRSAVARLLDFVKNFKACARAFEADDCCASEVRGI